MPVVNREIQVVREVQVLPLVELFNLKKRWGGEEIANIERQLINRLTFLIFEIFPGYREIELNRISAKDKSANVRNTINHLESIKCKLESRKTDAEKWLMGYLGVGLEHYSNLHTDENGKLSKKQGIAAELKRYYPRSESPSEILENTISDYLVIANAYLLAQAESKKEGRRSISGREHRRYLTVHLAQNWKAFANKPGRLSLGSGNTTRFTEYFEYAFRLAEDQVPDKKTVESYIRDAGI